MKMPKKVLANLEAEKMVLGAIVMNPERLEQIVPLVTPEDFYSPKHVTILKELLAMSMSKVPIDLPTLCFRVGDEVPSSYVSGLLDGLQKNANLDEPLKQIREFSQLRRILGQATHIFNAAESGNYEAALDVIAKSDLAAIKERHSKRLTDKVRDWVSVSERYFSVSDVCAALGIVSTNTKGRNNVRQILFTMCKKGELAHHPSDDRKYRRVETESIPMNFLEASTETLDITMPLDLGDLIRVYPKWIGVIAGEKDTGKSAWLLNFCKLNMKKWTIDYFSSEWAEQNLAERLDLHEDIQRHEWLFRAWARTRNFPDAVQANGINIFDWVGGEVVEAAYMINKIMYEILCKLEKGIALIAIQKDRGKDYGRGASYTLDYAQFYLTLSKPGIAKIEVAKSFRGNHSPVGKIMNYKLVSGWKFIPQSEWHDPECDKQYEKYKKGWIK